MWFRRSILFLGIFVLSINKKNLFANSKEKSYTKGRIEWILPIEIQNDSSLIIQLFKLSESALSDLEKNITYKTSDRIHLVAFADYFEFSQFQQDRNVIREISFPSHKNSPIGNVYSPILVLGNQIDLEIQIKKAVATQFLQEYLFGFSYNQKFNQNENQLISKWISQGFVAYFSEGITRDELKQFQLLMEKRAFKNLNFILDEHQIMFGKVVWYFIEQEKGKHQNGIFWSILKYVQSFDKTFEYHFGLNYERWLQDKVKHLNSVEQPNTIDVDFIIPLTISEWSKTQFKVSTEHDLITIEHSNRNSETQFIYSAVKQQIHERYTITYPHDAPFPDFKLGSFQTFSPKNNLLEIMWDKSWFLKTNDRKIPLGSMGSFKLIPSSQGIHILEESLGKTYYVQLDELDFKVIRRDLLNPNGEKVCDVKFHGYLNDTMSIYTIIHHKKDEEYESQIIKNTADLMQPEIIYSIKHKNPESGLKDLIVLDHNHLSFIKYTPTETAIYLLNPKDSENTPIRVYTKGVQFTQIPYGKDSIAEFYIANNQWNVNIMESNAPVYDHDTLKSLVSFIDSFSIKEEITMPKYLDTSKWFTSYFKKAGYKRKPLPAIQNKNHLWNIDPFYSWFYVHENKLYVDNDDFNIPYDGNVSPKEHYNGPLLFFYHFKLLEVWSKHRLDMTMYSNINRRKIGLELDYTYLDGHHLKHDIRFSYRLRQFDSEFSNTDRNRNLRVGYELSKRHSNNLKSSIGIEGFQNELILLNNLEYKTPKPNQRNHYVKGNLSGTYHQSFYWGTTLSGDVTLNGNFELGALTNFDKIRGMSSLNLKLHANGMFGILVWKSQISSRYSLSDYNISYMLGGTPGWISNSAFTNEYYHQINENQKLFLAGNMPLRGISTGTRIGHHSMCGQFDVGLPLLRLFPKSLKENLFWKNLVIYGFFDAGLAFFGNTPRHFSNPYNTIFIKSPNYILSASSAQNPWIHSYGMGIQTSILGYPFKVEYSEAQIGHIPKAPFLLFAFGKNF
jgi:hypothetical protein